MGARKDQSISYSCLTQEEVEAFYVQRGIDSKFNLVAPGLDKSIDQCLAGSIALYCRHFEFSNLWYDPSLLSFHCFFRLAKNSDWYTFETSQVDTCLISSMVTTLGSWKDRFFWVFESIVLSKMVWRHPDSVLNELKPSDSELDSWCLKSIRACPSRLCPFPELLLVLMSISKLWDKPHRDPVLMRDDQVMSALDLIKSDNTFDVVFTDAAATEGICQSCCFQGFHPSLHSS
ncbi:hypothetical protein HanPI659440_Chr17g0698691 [Helianthus annuus]|nr:hypothetical protein HanPI659440_Chr17g0698691 [Helianthus annuus]